MRRIRFRVQGSDARNGWFDAPIADAIRQTLTDSGWQVVSAINTTRPNGWTGLTALVFDFQVDVYDFYTDDYITNETIKEQLRADLSSILNIDWITALGVNEAVLPDSGGFIFDSTNTKAIKDALPDPFSLSIGMVLVGLAAVWMLSRK